MPLALGNHRQTTWGCELGSASSRQITFFFFLTAEKCGVAVSSIDVFGLKSEFYLLTESDFIKHQLGLVFIGPFQPDDYSIVF